MDSTELPQPYGTLKPHHKTIGCQPNLVNKHQERLTRLQKLGTLQVRKAVLSAAQQAWAARKGEAFQHEYRGKPSGFSGPTTLQLQLLRDRPSGKRKPLTPEEQAERDAESKRNVEAVLADHGIF